MRNAIRTLAALLVMCGGWASRAGAQQYPDVKVLADQPAATLLLPYFEVNLSKSNGMNTIFSISNASATAILAHVNVMTDESVLALGFNIYLTGYDVSTINMRDVISGNLPRTASAGQDPGDTISHKGPFSQDINFASCTGQLPLPALPANYVTHMQNILTGNASAIYSGTCGGLNYGDNVARGYITVDTVNNCTLRLPGDPAYYQNDITFQNTLWGNAYFLDTLNNTSRAAPVVHIAANLTDPRTNTANRYTYYGRYNGWNANDHRQPLSTSYMARYKWAAPFQNQPSLIVWRDPKINQVPFACGTFPSYSPLNQEGIVAFDEQEHPTVVTGTPFPAVTQRTPVGTGVLPLPSGSGQIYLNLNTTIIPAGNNPTSDPAASQAWVATVLSGAGANAYSAGAMAAQMDTAVNPSHFVP